MKFQSNRNGISLISECRGIAAWLLDSHLLTCAFAKCELTIFNPTAAALWLLLAEGRHNYVSLVSGYSAIFGLSENHAGHDVDQILKQWCAAGYLAANPDGIFQLTPIKQHDVLGELLPVSECLPEHDVFFNETFQLGQAVFCVCLGKTAAMDNNAFAERVAAMLRGFPSTTLKPNTRLQIVFTPDAFYLRNDAAPLSVWHTQLEALIQINLAIFRMAYPDAKLLCTLHAAAAGLNKSLVLSGVSGAGKSTLSAYLASQGWNYYGDDMVGLSEAGYILPFPAAAGLKEGSWPVLRAQHPALDALPDIVYGVKSARYLPLPTKALPDNSQRALAAWVFPTYMADAATQFEALGTLEALQLLIANGMALNAPIDVSGIHTLLNLLASLPKYRLVYSSLNDAAQCLQSLMAQ